MFDAARARVSGAHRVASHEVLADVVSSDVTSSHAASQTCEGAAHALFLSTRTVEHHVAAVLCKLDLPDRMAAARYARRHGVTTAREPARY